MHITNASIYDFDSPKYYITNRVIKCNDNFADSSDTLPSINYHLKTCMRSNKQQMNERMKRNNVL